MREREREGLYRVFDHSKIFVCCKRIQYIGDNNAKHYFKVIHVLVTIEDLSQHFSILNITWYFQMLLLRAAKQNNYTKRVINKCLCVCVCYCAPASVCVNVRGGVTCTEIRSAQSRHRGHGHSGRITHFPHRSHMEVDHTYAFSSGNIA